MCLQPLLCLIFALVLICLDANMRLFELVIRLWLMDATGGIIVASLLAMATDGE